MLIFSLKIHTIRTFWDVLLITHALLCLSVNGVGVAHVSCNIVT